jgi:hypothetical protein
MEILLPSCLGMFILIADTNLLDVIAKSPLGEEINWVLSYTELHPSLYLNPSKTIDIYVEWLVCY